SEDVVEVRRVPGPQRERAASLRRLRRRGQRHGGAREPDAAGRQEFATGEHAILLAELPAGYHRVAGRGGIMPGEVMDMIGIEYSTFSLVGRCERTGMFGIAIATSEMAVGSRCIHVRPGVGAIVTQASTNPRLGHLGLNLLAAGYSAPR